MHALRERLGQLLVAAAIVAVWEAVVRAGVVRAQILPPPSQVALALRRLLGDADLRAAAQVTGMELVTAIALAVPLAIVVGFIVGGSTALNRSIAPLLYLGNGVPKSLFISLFILAMGVGFNQKVAFGIFQAFFVVSVSTIAAVQAVPSGLLMVGRALRANRLQMNWYIYLPYMLPVILQGVRLGVIFAGVGILFAEMYVSKVGLGRLIILYMNNYQIANIIAGMLIASLGAITINEVFRGLERRVGRWRT